MLFNSVAYAIFFLFVALLYYRIPWRQRWALLLFSSCVFYMWLIPAYLLILVFVILVDYFAAFGIHKAKGSAKKRWLTISLFVNIGILCVFKYYDFLAINLHTLLSSIGIQTELIKFRWELPIGLSFHTFQAMSYTIEVYKGRQEPERHFGIYSVYVLFFPQLVAGPIERPQNLLHQFHEEQKFNYAQVVSGLRLIGLGLFKKVVVADRLAEIADPVFTSASFNGPGTAIGVLAFSIQIYCDFSGYSDIAVGSGRILGIKMMENFRRPYFASNIQEFWKRWHISLSTWFKDYLYIPLGGSRASTTRVACNIMLVFAVSGLWHGADWAFIIWGVTHGIFNVVSYLRRRYTRLDHRDCGLRYAFGVATTFGLVSLTWIWFRAGNYEQSLAIYNQLFSDWSIASFSQIKTQFDNHSVRIDGIAIVAFSSLIVIAIDWFLEKAPLDQWVDSLSQFKRWALYYSGFAYFLLFGSDGLEQFIYFQF